MIARRVVPMLLVWTGLSLAATPSAQQRAADGVALNDEGLPQYSTFSLCAIDPVTGQSGARVTTRVPFVGRAVPHVRAGVGAVCTQASTMVEFGPRGLDLLAKGVEPKDALAQLLASDDQRESRQVGIIDMKGRTAAHTGKENNAWAGSRQGRPTPTQANIMVGPEVARRGRDDVRSRAKAPGMPLAERMILAMEAGYAKGGDKRWGNLQSAAIKIADPNDPGRGGDFITLAIEVGENPEPVAELKRIYYTTGRRLGYRELLARGRRRRHRAEAHAARYRLLAAVARGVPGRAAVDQHAEDAGAAEDAIPRSTRRSPPSRAKANADYTREFSLFDEETIAAVDKFRADRNLNYQGNPAGLVDARLIDALRAAYFAKKKAAGKQ